MSELDLRSFQGWHGPGYETNDNADAGLRRRDGRPFPQGGEIVMLERGQYRGYAGMIAVGTPSDYGYWTAQIFCGMSGIYQDVRHDDFRIIGRALRTKTGRIRRTKHNAIVWQPSDGRSPMAGLKRIAP